MSRLAIFRVVLWAAIVVVISGLGVRWFLIEHPSLASLPEIRPPTGVGGSFSLVDQHGHGFTQADLAGRPTAMFFGYTFCPDVCPTTLLEASQWLEALGPDAERFRVVFVTVDPERDTPEKLAEFTGSFDRRIVALSGTRPEIDRILKAYRVFARRVDGKDGGYTMDHTAAVYLLDRQGRFTGVINFQEETSKALSKIRELIAAK